MTWLRLDDGFNTHPKILQLTEPERWRWLEALLWASRYHTKGELPTAANSAVFKLKTLRAKLIQVGLLDEVIHNTPNGTETKHFIHHWDHYNGPDPRILQAERARRHRAKTLLHRDGSVTDPYQYHDEGRDEERDQNIDSRNRHDARSRPFVLPAAAVKEETTAGATAAEPAAAASAFGLEEHSDPERLDTLLDGAGIDDARLRAQAHTCPDRATAWLERALSDGTVRNPAAFVRAGLDSGAWPNGGSPSAPIGPSSASIPSSSPSLAPDPVRACEHWIAGHAWDEATSTSAAVEEFGRIARRCRRDLGSAELFLLRSAWLAEHAVRYGAGKAGGPDVPALPSVP